jgi:hypothetical protein
LILFITMPLCAAAARPGWSKVELSGAGSAAAIAALLQPFGGEVIADYGSYTIAYVDSGSVADLTAAAGKQNIRIRTRDDLDVLELPGADLDAREGISGVAPNRLFQQYAPQQSGLFVLQFVAPARSEWIAEVQTIGWKISRYIPNDGYIVIGPPELVQQTRSLAYVQWLDFFHPYQKSAALAADSDAHDLLFELPAGAASEDAVAAISAAADAPVDVRRGSLDTLVYAHMSASAASALLSNPMILAVGPAPDGELADGRQVQSLTSLLNAAQTQPLPNQDYWSWVLSRCSECASMPSGLWKIGVADSGLDNGSPFFGHPDLAGRKFFGILGYGSNRPPDPECAAGQLLCDAHRHGTIVSGIAAGNGATGARDSGGYLMGLGAAPTAGIFMTKILTNTTGINPTFFFDWTADAANNLVTIQNHSWQSNSSPGLYTALSRMFDIAARDADDAATASRRPLLLSVAAGNDDAGTGLKTSPVGMAKNVLTVGGLENYRPEANVFDCRGTKGDSFWNIMRTSRNGTNLAGYIKPDVMAPASVIVSTQTSIWWPDPTQFPYCLTAYEGDQRYTGDSGTSFAAPLGSAAALIVKRYLSTDPANTSPALIRAVLVAGARSVRGGEDRSKNPAIPISAVPSQQQGFGRLTLEDILNGAQKPVVFDQSPARTFTQAGQTFCTRLRIRDASKPVKIALVWTDTPATAGMTNPLVNDLNLEVRRTSNTGRIYVGNSLNVTVNGEESIAHLTGGALPYDNVNNIEYFRSFMNANEEFNITVKAQNIAGDTDGNLANFEQDFALAILNADLVSVGTCDTPPTASFTVSCVDLTCTANGSASSDDFGIINYGYNWGDSVFTNGGAIQTHTYASPNTYSVVLTVTDTIQQNASTTRTAIACSPLGIATQPASQTITPGSSATLSVTPSGSGPFSYQWYEGLSGNTTIPVGTNSSTFNTGTLGVTKSYWVRVTSSCNVVHNVNSATATVNVVCTAPPTITQQPQSPTINSGQSVTLFVIATQAAAYQWYQGVSGNTTTPIGVNSNSITVTPGGTSSYWVRVSNSCGSVNSITATVTVCVPPTITIQPGSPTIPSGSTATLTVTVSGSGPFSYQWYEGASGNTSVPVGTNSPSFTTPPLFVNKQFWVKVTSTCNGTVSVNSNTANVTVTCNAAPVITANPTSRTINLGQSTTLTVTATTSGVTNYQWYQGNTGNTSAPVGSNSSSLIVTPSVTTNYWVRVSNACGNADSATATVTVCAPPVITTQPASTTIVTGQSATLTVVAGGSGPLSYQWYEGASGNTSLPVGTNSSSFNTGTLTATKSYWVRVTSTCNGTAIVNSNTATVTVVPQAIARRQLASNNVNSQRGITTNWTQATQAGNLLVAVISASTTPNFCVIQPPAGWQLAVTYEWNEVKSAIYYIPNNAGGRTAETFNIQQGFHDISLVLAEYSGVAPASPLDRTAFDGDNSNTGTLSSGITYTTSQPKELVITAMSVPVGTSFSNPTNGFTEIDDHAVLYYLTAAVHERITTTAGAWGHSATVASSGTQWVGVVATFKSANPN